MNNFNTASRLKNLTPAQLKLLKLIAKEKNSFTGNEENSQNQQVIHQDISYFIHEANHQFRVWAKKSEQVEKTCIDKRLVHKDYSENVLISSVEKLKQDIIIGEVFQNTSHPFFYEHPKDHVPGLYILEAARQFGTALAHLHYDVPLGQSFILNDLQAQFHRFAETSMPIYIIATISDKMYLDNQLFQLNNHLLLVQNERVFAEVKGNFKIFEATSYKHMRDRTMNHAHTLAAVNM
jgi:hypothetical protein